MHNKNDITHKITKTLTKIKMENLRGTKNYSSVESLQKHPFATFILQSEAYSS